MERRTKWLERRKQGPSLGPVVVCIEKNVAFHHADQAQLSHQTKSITCNPFSIACTASALEFAHLASLVREPFFCLFSHPLLTTSEPVACYAIVTSESVACSVLSSTPVRSPPLLEPVFSPTFCPIVTSDSVACSVLLPIFIQNTYTNSNNG